MRAVKTADNTGNITVEASLVVPVIILSVYLLIALGMIAYQKSLLVRTASQAAQQGAEFWNDSRKNMYNGAWDREEAGDGLYHSILSDGNRHYTEKLSLGSTDDSGNGKGTASGDAGDRKINGMRDVVLEGLSRGIAGSNEAELDIIYSNLIIQKKLQVQIKQNVKLPLASLLDIFGLEEGITLTGTACAVVTRPDEYIRNIDLGMELAESLGFVVNIRDKLEELKAKLPGVLNDNRG